MSRLANLLVCTLCLAFANIAQATLLARDVDGNGSIDAYYDSALGITWLANANLADTLTLGLEKGGTLGNWGIDTTGRMPWTTAQSWIAALNALNYLGSSAWRLPTATPINGVAFNYQPRNDGSRDVGMNISATGTMYAGSTAHELAHLFYQTLGNQAVVTPDGLSPTGCGSQPNDCMTNPGPFSALETLADDGDWWYGVATTQSLALSFEMDQGRTNNGLQSMVIGFAWPVVGGDVFADSGSVPEPDTLSLMLVGLGLAGWAMRSRKIQRTRT